MNMKKRANSRKIKRRFDRISCFKVSSIFAGKGFYLPRHQYHLVARLTFKAQSYQSFYHFGSLNFLAANFRLRWCQSGMNNGSDRSTVRPLGHFSQILM